MKSGQLLIIATVLSFLSAGCDKNERGNRDWPSVKTLEVTGINDEGAMFNAGIIGKNDFRIDKYGFAWDEKINPVIENSDKVVFSNEPVAASFSARISTTLRKDVLYHVRAFVITDDYLIYGEDVEFRSLGSSSPKIISFTPDSGQWGDTIQIRGKNFSYLDKKNIVKLGQVEAIPYYASDTLLKITVPEVENDASVKINISILGNNAISEKEFHYLIPEITGISPLSGTFLDTLTITGKNFGKEKRYNAVFFNDYPSEIISASPAGLKIKVPPDIVEKENTIKVITVGNILLYNQRFILNPPVVIAFEPDTIKNPNEIITLNIENLSPLIQNNKVFIGGNEASVLDISNKRIRVKLPDKCIPYFYTSVFDIVSVEVWVGSQKAHSLKNLVISWRSRWTRKKDFPGTARVKAIAFSINGKGFYGTGVNQPGQLLYNDFWEYDPQSDQWRQVADFPGGPRGSAVSFVINGKGYAGTGTDKYGVDTENDNNYFRDFYSYEPFSGSWTRIADFQGVGRYSAACFVTNNEAYLGTGHWGNDHPYGNLQNADDFWKYNPLTDSWTEVQKFPFPTSGAVGLTIGNTGYVFSDDFFYYYDGLSWVNLNTPSFMMIWELNSFSINNLGYWGIGYNYENGNNEMWSYNSISQKWDKQPMNYADRRSGGSVFVISDKAYIIGGYSYDTNALFNEVWEFDPSKP